MSECPFEKKLGDISEALCRSIRSAHPGLEYDTGIFHDWAKEHEPELHARERALTKRLGELLKAKDDFDAFRKTAVAWGKAVLEAYKRHEAWAKAARKAEGNEGLAGYVIDEAPCTGCGKKVTLVWPQGEKVPEAMCFTCLPEGAAPDTDESREEKAPPAIKGKGKGAKAYDRSPRQPEQARLI